MKINKILALSFIAILAVGTMGFFSTHAFAKSANAPVIQVQTTQAPDDDETAVKGPDTDNIEEQVGEQVEDGQPDTVDATNGTDTDVIDEQVGNQVEDGQADGAEDSAKDEAGADQFTPAYQGSISVDQTANENLSETEESAALAGNAKISLEKAKTAALSQYPGTTVVKAELDNENGVLVYSIELSNGTDVKVDAGNGSILFADAGGANEG